MNLYALFIEDAAGGRWWCTTTNRRQALREGRRLRAMVTCYPGPKDRWLGAWDAPTLRALSDPIADYRETARR